MPANALRRLDDRTPWGGRLASIARECAIGRREHVDRKAERDGSGTLSGVASMLEVYVVSCGALSRDAAARTRCGPSLGDWGAISIGEL
ncbi:MAG TPA: hypothetical protein VKP30_25175, partial [Polyangiaceae bacterium]|nr:hypothetical protein [Polyangiaceae bacterium]